MEISYGENFINSNNSKFISVDETQVQHSVVISQNNNNFSSLFMYDPNAVKKIFIHWLVINIPKNNFITNGEIKKKYYPPSPPKGSGDHQYFFQLYGHNTPLNINDNTVDDYESVSKYLLKNATLLQTLSFITHNKDENQELAVTSIQGGRKNKKIKSRIRIKKRTRRTSGRKTKRVRNIRNKTKKQ